jgi:DHA2 family multidrug resistance protein-like MFS transporter
VAQSLALVSLPFFLHGNLGYSAVQIGLLMTPWPLATSVLAPISGRLSDRYPAGLLGLAGLLMLALGLAGLALLPAQAGRLNVAWRMALAGAGFGLYQSPNNRTIISSAPHERSGGAAGTQGMARLLGQTVGAALAALLFSLTVQTSAAVTSLWLGVCFAAAGDSALRLTDLSKPTPK